MLNFGWLIVIPLLTTVLAHRKAHNAESVRLLRVNETVLPSGSDLVFSWAKCVICDGYDAHLYLQDTSGVRSIPHQLKSAVTSLKITNLPPRTVYRLVVKRLPSDIFTSEVTGRTSSPEAPLPVENLVARPLTNTSIQIEWTAKNADGFIARVFENGTAVQEKVIPDFSNHSIVNITNLKPETDYEVQVTAFYFPPAGNSISAVSLAQVRTLPLILPLLVLKWEFDSVLKLSWSNPESPAPLIHTLHCTEGPQTIFHASFRGHSDFVSIKNAAFHTDIDCLLETWYSIDERAVVTTRITALRPMMNLGDKSSSESVSCPDFGNLGDIRTASYKLEKVNGMEILKSSFSGTYPSALSFQGFQYKICERDGSCDLDWRTAPDADYPRLLLQPPDIKVWTPFIIQYRLQLRCPSHYRGRYGSSCPLPVGSCSEIPFRILRGARPNSSLDIVRSIEIPAMVGPVDPVTEIIATPSLVSWKYNRSTPSPAYFLLTHCNGSDCSSQSVPGERRSVSLGELKGSSIHYVTIQAVQVRDDRAYVSPTGFTTVVAPKMESSENANLTFTEIANSSTVQVHIAHNSSTDLPPVVEYHIDICSKPVSIWNDAAFASLLIANRTCKSEVLTNASVDVVRSPWTLYEVSVVVCYGAFDSDVSVNLTLPVYERAPSPLAGLSWSPGESRLSWKYDSPIPSGFSISICPSQEDAPDMCSDILAGPLDRQYHIVQSELTDNGFVVFVTPFVTYEGRVYNGTRSELAVKPLTLSTSPQH